MFVVAIYPWLRVRMPAWPPAALSLLDLVVVSAPLVAGVVVAARVAAGRCAGILPRHLVEVVLGLSVAALARAVTELVDPTAGSIGGPFAVEQTPALLAGLVVTVVGAVLVTPVVEELFFRWLLQSSIADGLARGARLGRMPAAAVAIVASTAAFVALHVLPEGDMSVAAIVGTAAVGLGCGILTVTTGRLAAAVIAHVAFNAAGIALLIW